MYEPESVRPAIGQARIRRGFGIRVEDEGRGLPVLTVQNVALSIVNNLWITC